MTQAATTPYRVRAQSVEACSCAHGCNCQFTGTPTEGMCEFVIGYLVEEGATDKMFTNPDDKRTQDYITGRFG